ncbi:hypothetical protein JW921_10570, partial [Candidatus Fermentibacterales bacterium]|nr:hypothetical protein [Candidatus Fermentibacterales bacterium]
MRDDLTSLLKQDLERLSRVLDPSPCEAARLLPGERRNVAVLFLDLQGFTSLSESHDHELMHRITSAVMGALSRIVEAHGGYVDKFEGDRIMALFGAREAHENDCVRAVSCGLRMLQALEDLGGHMSRSGLRLPARVGISYGSVTVAPDPSGHITATGDEVNLASRMETSAEPGTVMATLRVRTECGDLFQWLDLGDITVKGKSEPVSAWRPVGPGAVQRERWERASALARSPLVGRESELALISEAIDRHLSEGRRNRRGGAAHLVFDLVGEAGIGKSRLVHEACCSLLALRHEEGGVQVLRGSARSFAQPPFWLWSTLMRRLVGIPAAGSSDARERL